MNRRHSVLFVSLLLAGACGVGLVCDGQIRQLALALSPLAIGQFVLLIVMSIRSRRRLDSPTHELVSIPALSWNWTDHRGSDVFGAIPAESREPHSYRVRLCVWTPELSPLRYRYSMLVLLLLIASTVLLMDIDKWLVVVSVVVLAAVVRGLPLLRPVVFRVAEGRLDILRSWWWERNSGTVQTIDLRAASIHCDLDWGVVLIAHGNFSDKRLTAVGLGGFVDPVPLCRSLFGATVFAVSAA